METTIKMLIWATFGVVTTFNWSTTKRATCLSQNLDLALWLCPSMDFVWQNAHSIVWKRWNNVINNAPHMTLEHRFHTRHGNFFLSVSFLTTELNSCDQQAGYCTSKAWRWSQEHSKCLHSLGRRCRKQPFNHLRVDCHFWGVRSS